MDKKLASHSKFLSFVLRHSPETLGISLDVEGWVAIADLLSAIDRTERTIDHDLLLRIVHENDKQRFSISGDGLRIRANQGHSVAVDLGLAAQAPPIRLYHGTVSKFLGGIRADGLCAQGRHHVHLSADEATARMVARRRGDPVILRIDAETMSARGHDFFLSANGVWLTAHVPVEYIQFPV